VNLAPFLEANVKDDILPQTQLEFLFEAEQSVGLQSKSGLRVIQGGGQKKTERPSSRDAVIRVLVSTGADLLLRRISSQRAEAIQRHVDLVLEAFDLVDRDASEMPILESRLNELQDLMSHAESQKRQRSSAGF
jgi:hypothetical protein